MVNAQIEICTNLNKYRGHFSIWSRHDHFFVSTSTYMGLHAYHGQ